MSDESEEPLTVESLSGHFWWHVDDLNSRIRNLGSNVRRDFRKELIEAVTAAKDELFRAISEVEVQGGPQRQGSAGRTASEVQALRGELAHARKEFEEPVAFLTAEVAAIRTRGDATAESEVARLKVLSREAVSTLESQSVLKATSASPMAPDDALKVALYDKLLSKGHIQITPAGLFVCLAATLDARAEFRAESRYG
ncbi:hypothetical protein CYMTET_54513 [Cymbomonas tetramitiformis]|uniref:Uncharacterized protein n=1 Tax=Cymbomonas tetramitiformis TaxID=36881 RepID=A0AAE0BF13_9CHLO|nr:hypothetical protein CYMTET_54513 [Cymbomonas tetramitiformis]